MLLSDNNDNANYHNNENDGVGDKDFNAGNDDDDDNDDNNEEMALDVENAVLRFRPRGVVEPLRHALHPPPVIGVLVI